MTPIEFRDLQGEPTTWSAADFDSYTVLAETAPAVPYSTVQLESVAAGHLTDAEQQTAVAGRMAGEGHREAAGIWARGAQASYEFAAAAREGWTRYEAVLNGW